MTPDGKANGDNGGGPKELTQISAALVAVVGVVTSLAVTGVLAAAQRNHGTILLIGFAAVVAAALIWLLRGLIGTTKEAQAPQATAPTKEQPGWLLVAFLPGAKATGNAEEPGKKAQTEGDQVGANKLERPQGFWARLRASWPALIAALLFAVGLALAIFALIKTQQDAERPAVSAVFDAKTSILTAKITADGLSAERRMVVRVEPLTEIQGPHGEFLIKPDPPELYFAVIGPNSDGKISHEISVAIPSELKLVAVVAWTGAFPSGCLTAESGQSLEIPAREREGCLVLRLPEQTATTTTAPTTTTTPTAPTTAP
jgi:hypothetical protein